MSTVKIFSNITLSALVIPSLLFLTGCYPIEDSLTGPVLSGEAIVTIEENKQMASAQHKSRPDNGFFESIEMKLENNGTLTIFHLRFQPGVSTIRLNDVLSDQSVGATYIKTENMQFAAYSGKIRIEETTSEHIKGNFEFEMKRVPELLLHSNAADELISMYGEFYAVREH